MCIRDSLDNVTILDDLATQFGAQFIGVTIDSVTTSGAATVAANAAFGAANNTTPSLITHTGAPLAVGDTVQVVFTVTIDPDAGGTSSSGLTNQATSSGEALDPNGNPITDASGAPVTADDVSDNGTDPNGENGEDNMDGTVGNDPTPIVIADISVAKQQVPGSVTPLANGDFEVTYQLVVENTGNVDLGDVSLVDDIATQFGGAFVSAGSLTLITPPGILTATSSWIRQTGTVAQQLR